MITSAIDHNVINTIINNNFNDSIKQVIQLILENKHKKKGDLSDIYYSNREAIGLEDFSLNIYNAKQTFELEPYAYIDGQYTSTPLEKHHFLKNIKFEIKDKDVDIISLSFSKEIVSRNEKNQKQLLKLRIKVELEDNDTWINLMYNNHVEKSMGVLLDFKNIPCSDSSCDFLPTRCQKGTKEEQFALYLKEVFSGNDLELKWQVFNMFLYNNQITQEQKDLWLLTHDFDFKTIENYITQYLTLNLKNTHKSPEKIAKIKY